MQSRLTTGPVGVGTALAIGLYELRAPNDALPAASDPGASSGTLSATLGSANPSP